MSNQHKDTIAKKALIEMDNITAALKEESKKSLNVLLSEAVKTALREECEDSDCDYEVTDDESPKDKKKKNDSKKSKGDVDEDDNMNQEEPETSETQPQPVDQQNGQEQGEMAPEEAPIDNGGGEMNGQQNGSEEDVFSNYQVGDNTYDLTGENDQETLVKVYKLLNNDDNIIVRQDGNTLQLQDNEANTEYVIELGDDQEQEVGAPEDEYENLNEDFDVAGFPEDEEDEPNLNDEEEDFNNEFADDSEYDDLFDGFPSDDESPEVSDDWYDLEDDSEELFGSDKNNVNENKFSRKPMKNKKDVIFEIDLGYTDNYQDKDPIAGLSNNEPSKSGKSWHKGVPTGTEKPWAGDSKSKGKPFGKTKEVNEEDDMGMGDVSGDMSGDMEEATNVGGAVQQRSNSKSHIPNNRKEHGPYNKRHVSTAESGYDEIVAEMKAIKKQNKQLKESVQSLLKNLNEAYITNYNLGKITKLFVENVTTQDEKVDIVNRFANEAKTRKQSDKLFEAVKRELQKSHSNTGFDLNESSKTANGTKQLNESLNYASNDLLKTKDLMNRS